MTENECIKYTSIGQYKNLIRHVKLATTYDGKDADGNAIYVDRPLPTLKFNVSTKLHGTNASVRLSVVDGKFIAQSRERVLSLISDNAGYYAWVMKQEALWEAMCRDLLEEYPLFDTVVIYMEWAGKGIQKKVAVSEVEKFAYIFGVKFINSTTNEEKMLDIVQADRAILDATGIDVLYLNEKRIFLGTQFPIWQVEIDFNKPEIAQNILVDLCMRVEQECPVGKLFGVSGIGEGVVASYSDNKYGYLTCKVKGEEHVGKKSHGTPANLAPIDEAAFAKVSEWVDTYVTEGRLQQGLHVLKAEMQLEITDRNVGQYLRWLSNDVIREEQQSILDNDLDPKKIAKKVAEVGKRFYFNNLEG